MTTLYDQMTPAQQAEINRQEDEREARKADFYDPTEADLAEMAEAFGWNVPPSDEDMDAMFREHEEEMTARAEMESAVLLKYTGGQWA